MPASPFYGRLDAPSPGRAVAALQNTFRRLTLLRVLAAGQPADVEKPAFVRAAQLADDSPPAAVGLPRTFTALAAAAFARAISLPRMTCSVASSPALSLGGALLPRCRPSAALFAEGEARRRSRGDTPAGAGRVDVAARVRAALLQVTEALVASRGVVNRVLNYPVHAEAVSLASQVTREILVFQFRNVVLSVSECVG